MRHAPKPTQLETRTARRAVRRQLRDQLARDRQEQRAAFHRYVAEGLDRLARDEAAYRPGAEA